MVVGLQDTPITVASIEDFQLEGLTVQMGYHHQFLEHTNNSSTSIKMQAEYTSGASRMSAIGISSGCGYGMLPRQGYPEQYRYWYWSK